MPAAPTPWWTRPFRIMRRDYISEYDRLLAQDPAELAREAKEDFHVNAEWVMANLGCSPGMAHIVTFDTDKFEKLDVLGDRDVLRDYIPHAERRGIKVLAYINLHWFGYEFAEAHPDWEQLLADGEPYGRRHPLYGAGTTMCVNTPWRDWAFDLIREAAKTGIAGAFLDGPVVFPGACYCDACRRLFREPSGSDAPSEEDWRSETWKDWVEFREESMARFLTDARAALRSVNPDGCIYLNGGGYAAGAWRVARDIQRLSDCQDINGAEQFFHPTSGRHYILASALLGKYLGARNRVSQVYTHHALGAWHYIPLPVNEMKLAFAQTVAAGSNTWFAVWDRALEHSREEAQAAAETNAFVERHEAYFTDTRCAARVAMLVGSASNHWYLSQRKELYIEPGSGVERDLIADVAGGAVETQKRKGVCDGLVTGSTTGMFLALARSHLPVEILWDCDVAPEVLSRYDALALANTPCLSAGQREAIRDFVAAGGGLYADFESGMYDERGNPTDDRQWRTLLGIESVDGMFVPSRTEDYLQMTAAATQLGSYRPGQLVPRPVHILGVRPRADTQVPAVVTVPLGRSYMVPRGETDNPGLILGTLGKGRVAYCPGALSAVFGELGMLQHQRLINDMVRWVTRNPSPCKGEDHGCATSLPLEIRAPQSVYVEWRNKAPDTDLIHLVNNTADMHRPVGEFIPVRDITIRLARDRVSRVHSLRLDADIPYETRGGVVVATLPMLDEYDVVVIE
ncbi:MAG: hypothetical protein JSV65_06985 [Armatimonadota bacterium]|nr:MAG: hypothetical protein JSV65_06985 [Armatimonadota bacterium]